VTDLGGGIDELEGDFLQSGSLGLGQERLTEGENTLLGSHHGPLDHEPVLVNLTIVREASHRGDALLGQIVSGASVVLFLLLSDTVDLLVDLGSVVVSVLTGTGNLELNTSRMPSTDTGDLSQTTMGLTRETSDAPTSDDAVNSATLGDTDDVDHFVLLEDRVHSDLLLEETLTEVDLGGDVTTVDLDFLQVSLLLAELDLLHLGVGQQTDDGAVLLGAVDLGVHLVVLELLRVLNEGLLLGLVPVLVEASLHGLVQVTSEDGRQGTETTGGFDVSNETDSHHWGSFQDGDRLDDILLVDLASRAGDVADDVGHTSLEGHECGEVARLGGVILRERFDLTEVVLGALLREETQVSVTRALELTMRHFVSFFLKLSRVMHF